MVAIVVTLPVLVIIVICKRVMGHYTRYHITIIIINNYITSLLNGDTISTGNNIEMMSYDVTETIQ